MKTVICIILVFMVVVTLGFVFNITIPMNEKTMEMSDQIITGGQERG